MNNNFDPIEHYANILYSASLEIMLKRLKDKTFNLKNDKKILIYLLEDYKERLNK